MAITFAKILAASLSWASSRTFTVTWLADAVPGSRCAVASASCLRQRSAPACRAPGRRARLLRDRGVQRCDWPGAAALRARRPTAARDAAASAAALHPTILLMAGAHMMVDGYGNIYAPLLPLLIPRLGLVACGGGHADDAVSAGRIGCADRLRTPGRSLAAAPARDDGPGRCRSVLSLIGLATTPVMLAAILIVGRSWCGRVPSSCGRARASAWRRATRVLDVGLHHRRNTGLFAGPLMFAPFARAFRPRRGRRCWRCLGLLVVGFFLTRVPAMPLHPSAQRRPSRAAALREAARPALCHRRAAHADGAYRSRRSFRSC